MTQAPPRALPLLPRLAPGLLAAVAGGLLTGGFGAWAYYDDTFRLLAHTFGTWIVLVVLVSARQPWPVAVLRSVAGLAAAVLSFYVGKKVVYGVDYPGMPYPLDVDQIVEWLVLAVVAGCLLGWSCCRIGRPDRAGTVSAAAAVGLLVADAARRLWSWRYGWNWGFDHESAALTAVTVLGVALVLGIAVRSRRQLPAVVLWAVPMVALGLVLVSLPDALEQVLVTGGF